MFSASPAWGEKLFPLHFCVIFLYRNVRNSSSWEFFLEIRALPLPFKVYCLYISGPTPGYLRSEQGEGEEWDFTRSSFAGWASAEALIIDRDITNRKAQRLRPLSCVNGLCGWVTVASEHTTEGFLFIIPGSSFSSGWVKRPLHLFGNNVPLKHAAHRYSSNLFYE